ncbi:MAG: ribosome-associated translation inhibitor RaiA [Candidatus Taylorbacteria bacterium]|nr:ribosome-associated translation inhibitor RaiA [Candidatus Taylorbacteria bacterium]
MNTNIKTTNITLSASISEYTEKRLGKIAKFLDDDPTTQCDVELAKTTEHHKKGDIFKAEIHIVGSGKNLYATADREDLYVAIDAVRDEILQELNARREKRISFVRRGGAKVKAMVKGMWPWGRN